jgi:3-hydroxyacyl-[acyl-carrier protein] dehydratase / trans-2-decenoyl-[acyl-carrier protein] isomerase
MAAEAVDRGDAPWLTMTEYTQAQILQNALGEWGPRFPRLPEPPMLMIKSISGLREFDPKFGGRICGEFNLRPDSWFFKCHFPGDPLVPGWLLTEALSQLAGFYLGRHGASGKGRVMGVGEVSFKEEILPSAKSVFLTLDVKKLFTGSGRKKSMVVANGTVHVITGDSTNAEAKLAAALNDLKVFMVR